MNGFLYDIKRTLSGKFTIILILLLVLITVATAYGAGISAETAAPAQTDIVLPYVNDTGGIIHVSDYVINGYGQPVSGLSITSSIGNNTANIIKNYTGNTDSHGYLNFTVNSSSPGFYYIYTCQYRNGNPLMYHNNEIIYYNGKMGQFQSSSSIDPCYSTYFNDSFEPVYAVILKDKANPSQISTMVYVPYINSSVNNQPLYISYNISTMYEGNNANNAGTGNITEMAHPGVLIITPPLTTKDLDKHVNFFISNKTEEIVPGVSYTYTYIKPGVALQNGLAIYFGILLIPIMAIFSAYFYYSKDKTSGVLESIIARPITKGKLMISRFAGNSVSFLVGLLISFGLADIILKHYTGVYISSGTFATMLLGYLVEAVGFAGLIYLITQFEKTQGQILGTGIGLLFILGFMWTTVSEAILFIFHITSTTHFLKDLLVLDSISPSYFPDIIADYHLGVYSSISASSAGINIYSVALIGLAWILIPSLLALYFARKRD
jgi:ABC-2 type transport system permease protein